MQISSSTANYIGTNVGYSQEKKVSAEDSKRLGSEQEDKKTKDSHNGLDNAEKKVVDKLQARDTEVRAHESAHMAAGGGMTGGASFTYQQGPDGKMYAIGGEVSISMKGGSTPEETIANAQQVIRAALAPADPSPQDIAVATQAKSMISQAQQEKAKEELEKNQGLETYRSSSTSQNSDEDKEKFDISA